MTPTHPEAVERLEPVSNLMGTYMTAKAEGRYVRHTDYAALSAQLKMVLDRETANFSRRRCRLRLIHRLRVRLFGLRDVAVMAPQCVTRVDEH